ncbi:MAG: hypothetical protein KA234_00525 [Saprospiraceae bacterium]|nr:hypothetical protein [Saprospiraceae bacterium]
MITKVIIERISFNRVGNSIRAIINTYFQIVDENEKTISFDIERNGKPKKVYLADTSNHITKFEFQATGHTLDQAVDNAVKDLVAGEYSGFEARLDWPDFDYYDTISYTNGIVVYSCSSLRDMIDSKLLGVKVSDIKLKIK